MTNYYEILINHASTIQNQNRRHNTTHDWLPSQIKNMSRFITRRYSTLKVLTRTTMKGAQ